MTPAFKRGSEGGPLNTREDLVRLISDLARHLAVELDYHYEDDDARHPIEPLLALENAVGAATQRQPGPGRCVPRHRTVHGSNR